MSGISQQISTLLKTAAGLRVRGAAWAEIAGEVKRKEQTVRCWPSEYPDEWRAAYDAAYEAEWARLESLARSCHEDLIADPTTPAAVRQSAAHSLIANAIKLRPARVQHSGDVRMEIKLHVPGVDDDTDD